MDILPAELAGLPPPSLVEIISFEARYADLRAKLISIYADFGLEYDVGFLETDPDQILLQDAAYQDILLRQRINEAIRSWFLAYASGGDLDVLAQWYDVYRMAGETDDRLKRRVIKNIQGRSTGGTEARYTAIALGADIRVADAKPYTVGRDPTINVAVFATDNAGVADTALLAKVNAALQAPTVRMMNDTIVVASAAQTVVTVSAQIWLLPQAPEATLSDAEANLRTAWSRDMLLGRDLTHSWLTSKLQIDGVQRVVLTAPAADVVMPFNRAAALGAVTLTKMGRDY